VYSFFKRTFDVLIAAIFIIIFSVPLVLISLIIKITSKGRILHWSKRVGRNSDLFQMPKFRSMKMDTPNVATHLLDNPDEYLTKIGKFLRATSLDELPQLWSILIGDMSFVGPRPALYNQDDLISLRRDLDVDKIPPGLTGWAQVNGRDKITIEEKVKLDLYYYKEKNLLLDFKILLKTFIDVFYSKDIDH
jgi:O-antigen biosynthesis protein WbqP